MIQRMLLLLALITSLSVAAADAEPAEKQAQEETEEVKPATDGAEASTKTKSDDIFVPTENISEDAAVPFPVDI